jgi:hypothetical protein
MADTWIVDLRHYLTPVGTLAALPTRGRVLAEYFTQIVAQGSNFDARSPCAVVVDHGGAPAPACWRSASIWIWMAWSGYARSAATTASFEGGREHFGTTARILNKLADRRLRRTAFAAQRSWTPSRIWLAFPDMCQGAKSALCLKGWG